MELRPGATLGPYEIVSPIGEGGMGEVWKARDTRLGREVALKVTKSEFTERFAREARTVAALNHPNICTLYDVGPNYLVMELIDGAPLKGPLPVDKAVEYAGQILDALDAAHRKHITHRDLKPANVLVTKQGIKLLDFGLAKQVLSLKDDASTVTALTVEGQIAGTLQYMAPEQLHGKDADSRSDIFAFGCVLYEMLSGARAFRGSSAASVIAAILEREPEPLSTAPPLDRVIRACLSKDPDQRIQNALDVKRDLLWAVNTSAPAAPAKVRSPWLVAAAIGLVVLGVAAYLLMGRAPQQNDWTGAILGGPEVAFNPRPSPDGHLVAFHALDHGYTQVVVMKPETGNWSMLTHSQLHGSVTNVSWAPDGASIYYDRATTVPQGIYNIPVLGGDERLIFANAFRPEALADGSLLAVKLNATHEWQLFRFWPGTGRVQDLPIAAMDPNDSLQNVRVFPDGKEAVIDGSPLGQEAGGPRLLLVDLATGATRPLAPSLPRGSGAPDFAVSRDGKSVLVSVQIGSFTRMVSVPIHSQSPIQTLFTTAGQIWYIDSAPDGSVYGCVVDLPAELVSRPLDRGQVESIARLPAVADPNLIALLPDGRVVVTADFSGRARLLVAEQGKNPVAMVTTTEETSAPLAVAGPREIAFLIGPVPRDTIGIAEIETGRVTRRIAPGKGRIVSLAASPDGGTLYFSDGTTVWSIASSGGEARKIRAGNRVVADSNGRALLVSVLASPQMRLFRVPLDGGPGKEILADGSHALDYSLLSAGAWNADGQLLVSLQDSWLYAPALLDTGTGHVLPLPFDNASDYVSMVWQSSSRIVALRLGMRSTLWRFVSAHQ